MPRNLHAWLQDQSRKGARIIGVRAGAKAVAAAGLLNGRRATTHWYYLGEMLERSPSIDYVFSPEDVVRRPVQTPIRIRRAKCPRKAVQFFRSSSPSPPQRKEAQWRAAVGSASRFNIAQVDRYCPPSKSPSNGRGLSSAKTGANTYRGPDQDTVWIFGPDA
jgi:hypothetical protein